MYAVIEFKWHQYIVNEGLELIIDHVEWDEKSKLDITDVLSVFDEKGEKVSVGKPYVAGAKVTCELWETSKWEKINVLKFKRKNRYERNFWFRPLQTVLKIKKIQLDD